MTGPQFTSISDSFSGKRKQREPRFSWSWKTRGRLVRWPPSLCRLYFPCCLRPEVWRGSSGSKLAPHHLCGFNRKTSLFCFHKHRPDFQPLSVPSVLLEAVWRSGMAALCCGPFLSQTSLALIVFTGGS